jgi:integrase
MIRRLNAMSTLVQAWEMFRAERAVTLCPTSLTSDYTTVDKWLRRCPIEDFAKGRQIMGWVLTQKPPKSARRVAMYLKSLYRWASTEDVGLIERSPVTNYRMPKPPQGGEEIVVIPRHETAIVLLALERKTEPNWSLYAEWMLQSAMRTGEVRALRWRDIKDDRILVHQNFTLTHGLKESTKTNRQRWVPLNERCKAILEQLDQSNEFLFPWNRHAYQSFFYDRMRQAAAVGLIERRYRPYDLRHTAISRFIEAGIPVAQVAAWCGNSSEVIWKHYAGVSQEYAMPVL